MSEVAKSPIFGLSGLFSLSGDPISLLESIPERAKVVFRRYFKGIERVVLATNETKPQRYLQALAKGINKAGMGTVEIYACVGMGIASLQGLSDLIYARSTGLLIVLDDPSEVSTVLICLISTHPVLTLPSKCLIYTLNSPQTERITALETDLEALETYMLSKPGSIWHYVGKLALITAETEDLGLFLAIVHRDMISFPLEYGEIGKIARALDLNNPHHRLMMENYANSAYKCRLEVSFIGKHGVPRKGNYGLITQLGEWVCAGLQGSVLCLIEGESRQTAVSIWTVLPHTEEQVKTIRQAFQPPSSKL